MLERLTGPAERRAKGINAGMPRFSEEVLRPLPEDPRADLVTAFEVWEEAGNYDEPERFFGERVEQMRAPSKRVSGKAGIRPEGMAGEWRRRVLAAEVRLKLAGAAKPGA